jgi:mandelate racemase
VISKLGRFSEWPIILVDLHTREGVTGHSYLEPYLKNSARYIAPVIRDLVDAFAGSPSSPTDLFRRARSSLSLIGLEGVSLAAVSAIDMALWDAVAKTAGMPLCVYLGGNVGPVPAYNSNGLWLMAPKMLAKEAAELIAEGGFTGLKLRLGRDRLGDDLDAIRAAREGAGREALLMVDFNQGLSLDRALHRLRELDDEGLYWFEEPIAYDNLDAFAVLRQKIKTPLQIGENFWGPRNAEIALQRGACDFIMPDMMRIGGVTGWLQTAAIAAAKGAPMSTHLYPEISAHLMRVTETAHWLEWQDWAAPILARPFSVVSGAVSIPSAPGIGLDWNESAVERYGYAC